MPKVYSSFYRLKSAEKQIGSQEEKLRHKIFDTMGGWEAEGSQLYAAMAGPDASSSTLAMCSSGAQVAPQVHLEFQTPRLHQQLGWEEDIWTFLANKYLQQWILTAANKWVGHISTWLWIAGQAAKDLQKLSKCISEYSAKQTTDNLWGQHPRDLIYSISSFSQGQNQLRTQDKLSYKISMTHPGKTVWPWSSKHMHRHLLCTAAIQVSSQLCKLIMCSSASWNGPHSAAKNAVCTSHMVGVSVPIRLFGYTMFL